MLFHRLPACVLGFFLSTAAAAQTVTIGAENDAAPWSYADGSGYVNDLVRATYREVGWKVNYRILPYGRCKLMTEAGSLIACFTTSRTAQTEAKFLFPSAPVFTAQNVLFTHQASTLKGCDAKSWGRKISVAFVSEYEYSPEVEALQRSGTISVNMIAAEILLLRMLDKRRFDAALITVDPVKRIELMATLARVKPNFKLVCNFGTLRGYVAFSRVHPGANAALAAYNKGMAIITSRGVDKRLRAKWAAKALSLAVGAQK